MAQKSVAIIGSGLIGRSWTMLFMDAKYKVFLYDLNGYIIQEAIMDIRNQWFYLSQHELTRDSQANYDKLERLVATISLKDALKDAFFVMECVPENLELKRKIWKDIDDLVGPDVILTSSASVMLPSAFTDHLKNRKNFVVAHPVNPPYYVPLVELVPAPWTDKAIVEKTRVLMTEIGMSPVTLNKEITGYVNNRLQVTLINEIIHLLNDGILEPNDIDKVMKDGLGRRYAFLGVLEVAFLNADGFLDYIKKYGPAIEAVAKSLKPPPKIANPCAEQVLLYDKIVKDLDSNPPYWHNFRLRKDWRDFAAMKLVHLKKELNELKKGEGLPKAPKDV